MFINLEQTQNDLLHSQELVAHVDIGTIKLRSANVFRQPHSVIRTAKQLEIRVSFQTKQLELIESALISEIDFSFRAVPAATDPTESKEEAEDAIRIDCSIEAIYQVREDYKPTEEQRKAFLEGNAVFNCWPYFREFVQSCSARMELPVPPIPFLRVSVKGPEVEQEEEDAPE